MKETVISSAQRRLTALHYEIIQVITYFSMSSKSPFQDLETRVGNPNPNIYKGTNALFKLGKNIILHIFKNLLEPNQIQKFIGRKMEKKRRIPSSQLLLFRQFIKKKKK